MSCRHCILIPFTIALASLTLGEQKNCDYYPRGGSVSIPVKLEYQGNHLIWRKDEQIIFERKRGTIKEGKEADITPGGDLKLNNLQASHDGKYQGQVYDHEGKSHKNTAKKICVIERVTKPTVQLDCKTTTLTCIVEPNPTAPTFSWQGDKKVLPDKSSKIQLQSGQRKLSKYSCSVKNHVSNATSDEIEINCEDEKSADKVTFLGTSFGFWLEILILAGGGILLVILVVVVVVCVCRRRRHRLQLLHDEEEFRLTNLTHSQQPHSHGHHSHQAPPQKTQAPPQMTHAGQYGHPHSDAHPPALPKPRGQSRPRPAHPPGPAHGQEDLPPRPKPRKGPRPPRS